MPNIQNCTIKYQCTANWNQLDKLSDNDSVRFCQSCQQNVYACHTESDIVSHVVKGHCIAIFNISEQLFVGEMSAPYG